MKELPFYKPAVPRFEQSFEPMTFIEPKAEGLDKVELSLFAIIRNCGRRVREWLAFHYVIGVERFIIALHNCEDNTEEEILKLPFQDRIVLHRLPTEAKLPQLGGYIRLLEMYGNTTHWAAILDDDEFLFSPVSDDIKPIVRMYNAYGGVAVNWVWFGSNNNVTAPEGPIIESYTKRANENYFFNWGCKSIVKPDCIKTIISPHLFETVPVCCNEEFSPVPQGAYWKNETPPSTKLLRVNHYKVRSMQDWCDRFRRGDCTLKNPMPVDVERFKSEDRNDIEDFTILKHLDKIKEILQQ